MEDYFDYLIIKERIFEEIIWLLVTEIIKT